MKCVVVQNIFAENLRNNERFVFAVEEKKIDRGNKSKQHFCDNDFKMNRNLFLFSDVVEYYNI